MLHTTYGTPHLGNLADPTDELVYIILSRKTRESAYRAVFAQLRARGTWEQIADLSEVELARVLRGGGLEAKKARALRSALGSLRDRFGVVSLEGARGLGDDELFELLCGLPEVGPKSARCIMMYSFGRTTFAVDTHVGRVLARLGTTAPLTGDLTSHDHKRRQQLLADAIPPDLRFSLHVNLIVHGRTVCRAIAPQCDSCVLLHRCGYGQAATPR